MRMNLTDEEAKAILRMREIEDAHRSGWNKALQTVCDLIDSFDTELSMQTLAIQRRIQELKK